jgi:hypothetical protein
VSKIVYVVNGKKVDSKPVASEERQRAFLEELANHQIARCMTDDVASAAVQTVAQAVEENPDHMNRICKLAEKNGHRPLPGDHYFPNLAQYEGDPRAFIGHDVRGGVTRLAEANNQAITDGMVKVKSREPEEDPHENPVHRLHPKIVKRIKTKKIKENPDLAHANQAELTEEIVDKHGA